MSAPESAKIQIPTATEFSPAPERPKAVEELPDEVRRGEQEEEPEPVQIADTLEAGFSPEEAAGAAGEGLAGRLRAKREERLGVEKWFDLPGWGGDLQIQVRPYSRRRELQTGVAPEKFIIGATAVIRYRDTPDDDWQEIPGRWGKAFASMLGVNVDGERAPASALVRTVFQRKVEGEWVDNPAAVDAFALVLMEWMVGEQDAADAELGEY